MQKGFYYINIKGEILQYLMQLTFCPFLLLWFLFFILFYVIFCFVLFCFWFFSFLVLSFFWVWCFECSNIFELYARLNFLGFILFVFFKIHDVFLCSFCMISVRMYIIDWTIRMHFQKKQKNKTRKQKTKYNNNTIQVCCVLVND